MPEVLRESDIEQVAELLKILAHPIRLKIIKLLSQYHELNVMSIQQQIVISQSLVSHHLIKMNDKGILISVRRSKAIYYSLANPLLADWLSSVTKIGLHCSKTGKL